jgi:type IV secretion system protein VirB5
MTDKAAVTLNEHAREKDPFAKVGRETIAVEVTSVVRASDASFQVRWLERTFEGGALKDTRRPTGLFSIVITPPRTVDAVRKEPWQPAARVRIPSSMPTDDLARPR